MELDSEKPSGDITKTQTWQVLYKWREMFGLSLTAHALCHVMRRPWSEIREELLGTYDKGAVFRVVDCGDIGDIAYYVDYPWGVINNLLAQVRNYPQLVEYSDKKIDAYPPEQGYVGSWMGKPSKEYKFRDKARAKKSSWGPPVFTDEQIIEILRGAIHAS